jgi:hypothetical protein
VSAISASRNGSVTSRPGTDAVAPSPTSPPVFFRSELSIVMSSDASSDAVPECAASAALASCRSFLRFAPQPPPPGTPHSYLLPQTQQPPALVLPTSVLAAAVRVAHARCDVVQPTGGRRMAA